jgi:thioredoxin reductase (NADPH)
MSPPVPGTRRDGLINLRTTDGRQVIARTVVIASGAKYRRPNITQVTEFDGAGISYWASPIEAKLCENQDIVVVGGGNSAGQAIAYLGPKVNRLHLVIRRELVDTMSTYLIDRIAALQNVVMHVGCELKSVSGDSTLLNVSVRNLKSAKEIELGVRQIFMFIGADPNTSWLCPNIKTDRSGFIVTGTAFDPFIEQEIGRVALPLETSVPAIFAIGDVRAGSTKRVAAAVGEGAAVVSQIHSALTYLKSRDPAGPPIVAPPENKAH